MNKKFRIKSCAFFLAACLVLANLIQIPVVRATESSGHADTQFDTTEEGTLPGDTVSSDAENGITSEPSDSESNVADTPGSDIAGGEVTAEDPEEADEENEDNSDDADTAASKSYKTTSNGGNVVPTSRIITTTDPTSDGENADEASVEDGTDEADAGEEVDAGEGTQIEPINLEPVGEEVKTGDNSFKSMIVWIFTTLASALIGICAIVLRKKNVSKRVHRRVHR